MYIVIDSIVFSLAYHQKSCVQSIFIFLAPKEVLIYQLNSFVHIILTCRCSVKPKIIVLILDQSSFGADLFRREIFVQRPTKLTINYLKKYINILDSKSLNLFKLYSILNNYVNYQKKNYKINLLQTFRFIIHKIYLVKFTNTPIILSPLIYGIDKNQEKFFYKLLNIYFELANDNIEKLIIVTHPHKNHINDLYKLNLSSLIDKYISEKKLEEKILHINFSNEIQSRNIDVSDLFEQGDIFSHITEEKFLHYYYPRILEELKNTKLLTHQ